jgi:CTP-dependent riboflavin kinase
MTRMTGVIFSDLGLASSFMSLDWVQLALKQCLGFVPFPATLNIRPKAAEDAETTAAILVPEVKDYPGDKIEIVAPLRLKEHLGVRDGDAITLEFRN